MILTEEEKDVYLKEGFKIPTRQPLTKVNFFFLFCFFFLFFKI